MTAAIHQLVVMFMLTQKTNVFHAHVFRRTDAFNVTLQTQIKYRNHRCEVLILIVNQY